MYAELSTYNVFPFIEVYGKKILSVANLDVSPLKCTLHGNVSYWNIPSDIFNYKRFLICIIGVYKLQTFTFISLKSV